MAEKINNAARGDKEALERRSEILLSGRAIKVLRPRKCGCGI